MFVLALGLCGDFWMEIRKSVCPVFVFVVAFKCDWVGCEACGVIGYRRGDGIYHFMNLVDGEFHGLREIGGGN